jgi:hypothetical protein
MTKNRQSNSAPKEESPVEAEGPRNHVATTTATVTNDYPWKDLPSEMTWGRRIALYLASRYSWYNPALLSSSNDQQGSETSPSLSKAWALFEHVTLERYLVSDGDNVHTQAESEARDKKKLLLPSWTRRITTLFCRGDHRLRLAEPGEDTLRTRLYSPITTPLSQIGDFGLGYGLYFSTLRSFAILSLLAGILNLPNIMYFASDEYNTNGQNDLQSSLLKGSAICTDVSWVPCPDCPIEYKYPKLTFSKWSHTTGLYVEQVDEGGTWVNVTSYISLAPVNHSVREETMYHYFNSNDDDNINNLGGDVFTAESLAAFQQDLGVTITPTTISFPDGSESICKDPLGLMFRKLMFDSSAGRIPIDLIVSMI